MAETLPSPRMRLLARAGTAFAERSDLVRAYMAAVSGAGGRLVFSLAYFVILANTLSLADFGLFATASAAGVMISRLLAFGFIAPLYRTATVRPRLIGTFTAGFFFMAVLSLPLVAAASALIYMLFFSESVSLPIFAGVVVAEILLWRVVEVAIIVNNGMGRFGIASIMTILGTALRAALALVFTFEADRSLESWTLHYLAANAIALVLAYGLFYPHQRLRLRPKLYWRRLADSAWVAGAELLFYLQMEFDKFLVLAVGGPHFAGLYAIVMRLVDLTAIPVRTFTMMLVQKMMRVPDLLGSLKMRCAIEGGILLVSTAGLGALALVLHVFPNALGSNVAQGAGLVALGFLVPGARNIVEYHAELLFARGQTLVRALNLALLASAKAVLLLLVLSGGGEPSDLLWKLNAVFAGLYLVSAALTYSALRMPAKSV